MKVIKGKNWIEFEITKHRGLYIGPLWAEEKDIQGRYRYKLFSFKLRRFKLRIILDRQKKAWEVNFAGLYTNQNTKNMFMRYRAEMVPAAPVSQLVDKS